MWFVVHKKKHHQFVLKEFNSRALQAVELAHSRELVVDRLIGELLHRCRLQVLMDLVHVFCPSSGSKAFADLLVIAVHAFSSLWSAHSCISVCMCAPNLQAEAERDREVEREKEREIER